MSQNNISDDSLKIASFVSAKTTTNKLVAFLMSEYPNFFSKGEAKNFVNETFGKGRLTERDFENKTKKFISYLNSYKSVKLSVKSTEQEEKKIYITKVIKKFIKENSIRIGLGAIASVTLFVGGKFVKDNAFNQTYSYSIKQSLEELKDNETSVLIENSFNKDGEVYYLEGQIAEDVVQACSKDERLIPGYLISVYHEYKNYKGYSQEASEKFMNVVLEEVVKELKSKVEKVPDVGLSMTVLTELISYNNFMDLYNNYKGEKLGELAEIAENLLQEQKKVER